MRPASGVLALVVFGVVVVIVGGEAMQFGLREGSERYDHLDNDNDNDNDNNDRGAKRTP